MQVNDVNRVESAGFCDRFSRVGVGEVSVGRLLSVNPDFQPERRGGCTWSRGDMQAQR